MPMHTHVDGLQALETASEMFEGKNEAIVACRQCRDRISKCLIQLASNASEEKRGMATILSYQMEMKAYRYQDAVAVSKNPDELTDFESDLVGKLSQLPVLNDENRISL